MMQGTSTRGGLGHGVNPTVSIGPRKVQALFVVVGPVGDVQPVLHLGPGGFCKWITSKALIGADFEVGVQLSCPPRSDPQTCGRLKVPLYTTIRPLALLSYRRWSYGSFMAMCGSITCPWSCMTWILLRTLMDTSLCESVGTKSLGRFPIRTLSARLISSHHAGGSSTRGLAHGTASPTCPSSLSSTSVTGTP